MSYRSESKITKAVNYRAQSQQKSFHFVKSRLREADASAGEQSFIRRRTRRTIQVKSPIKYEKKKKKKLGDHWTGYHRQC